MLDVVRIAFARGVGAEARRSRLRAGSCRSKVEKKGVWISNQ